MGPTPAQPQKPDRLFERRGQHVYFEAPGALGLDGVYAFARSKGLIVLDVRPMAGHYIVKAVDTPVVAAGDYIFRAGDRGDLG